MKKLLVVMMAVMAITGLLVAPSFGAQKLLVKDGGANNVFVVDDIGQASLTGSSADGKFIIQGAAESATAGKAMLLFQRSRGTAAAPTAVQTGDFLGQFNLSGATGAATFDGARRIFQVEASENWGPTAGGYKFGFYTRANSSGLGAPTERMTISHNGNVGIGNSAPGMIFTVGVNGAGYNGTQFVNGSSREYKDKIETLSADKALDTIKNMTPVTYVYKNTPDQKLVGFIAEDVPDLVATPDRKGLSAMDIVAVLTKVVQEQNKTIEALSAKVDKLEKTTIK